MIDFLKKEQAILKMNKWGAVGVPFFFMVDFDMEKVIVLPLDELTANGIRLKMPDDVIQYKSELIDAVERENSKNVTLISEVYPFGLYKSQFENVLSHIKGGDSFLVNLTCQTPIELNLTLDALFDQVTSKYKLLYDTKILTYSPETFMRIKDGVISSCPMKGTLDARIPNAREVLIGNPKEAAEHSTIVDLIRNDLSMVASDVRVVRFRYIDEILAGSGSLLQVSSEITGRLPENYPSRIGSILFTMLPAGSVTGAPKKRTVEIIRNTEVYHRGYYTGIFGIFDGHQLDSAVSIRFIEKTQAGYVYKSGGGITAQSNVEEEYEEMQRKVYAPVY